jgi:hypothetical protein
MKKTLWRLGTLVAGLLVGAPAAQAQRAVKVPPTAAELKKDIIRIRSGTEGESDAFDNLTVTTARRLVTYLKSHELTAVGAKALGLDYTESTDAGHLKVFTYSYSSGGTRGTIHRPVLQWQNAAGQRFAYSMDEECWFMEAYKLASPGRTQYLLLGADKGDGQCDNFQARVVEVKGNYLLLDNAAFEGQPALRLCNVDMDFLPAQQLLRLNLAEYSTEHDEVLPPQWHRPGAKQLSLKFSNGRFVKSHY